MGFKTYSPGALGCSDASFPVYRGNTDMELVHRNMPITLEVFNVFVDAFEEVALGALSEKVPTAEADVAAVVSLLRSPGIAIMCNQDGCPEPQGEYVLKPGCDEPTAPPTTSDEPPTTVIEETPVEESANAEMTAAPTGDNAAALALSTLALIVALMINF